jgi:hypothetical protein
MWSVHYERARHRRIAINLERWQWILAERV